MRTDSISRTALKDYIPTFSAEKSKKKIDISGIVKDDTKELSEEQLLALIKLLHSVYLDEAA